MVLSRPWWRFDSCCGPFRPNQTFARPDAEKSRGESSGAIARVVSTSGEPVKSGQLGTADLTASTVANIGPGIDFYFAFGVIAVTAGVAAPLTILAAGVAVVLLAFIVAEFTKVEPSAGSFITYVETALGARAGVVVALLVVGDGGAETLRLAVLLSAPCRTTFSALMLAVPANVAWDRSSSGSP